METRGVSPRLTRVIQAWRWGMTGRRRHELEKRLTSDISSLSPSLSLSHTRLSIIRSLHGLCVVASGPLGQCWSLGAKSRSGEWPGHDPNLARHRLSSFHLQLDRVICNMQAGPTKYTPPSFVGDNSQDEAIFLATWRTSSRSPTTQIWGRLKI